MKQLIYFEIFWHENSNNCSLSSKLWIPIQLLDYYNIILDFHSMFYI